MTEQEAKYEIIEHKPIIGFPKYVKALNIAIKALEEVQQYRAIGTVEELKESKEQYDNINCAAKSVHLSGLCDFENAKGKIISEIKRNYECSLRDYEAIGTPDECRAAVEKQKAKKELESHDEKYILKSCLGLMKDMVDKFAEWYRWQHGEDAIEELDEEERFCIRKTYFRIVQELFLLGTNHSGGTSTRAKCEQLGVDWGEEIEFNWRDEE